MRRTVSSLIGLAAVVAVTILLVSVGMWKSQPVRKALFHTAATAFAQTGHGENTQSGADTAKAASGAASATKQTEQAAEETKKREKGSVNIRIDESGISIEGNEGDEGEADTSGTHIIIDKSGWSRVGGKWQHKEKGEDIVRFGEDVIANTGGRCAMAFRRPPDGGPG